jgi:hypothetical protein
MHQDLAAAPRWKPLAAPHYAGEPLRCLIPGLILTIRIKILAWLADVRRPIRAVHTRI